MAIAGAAKFIEIMAEQARTDGEPTGRQNFAHFQIVEAHPSLRDNGQDRWMCWRRLERHHAVVLCYSCRQQVGERNHLIPSVERMRLTTPAVSGLRLLSGAETFVERRQFAQGNHTVFVCGGQRPASVERQ